MTPAADPAPASLYPDGPGVVIVFRPPCRYEKSELFGAAPHGVEAGDVVKALCRCLDRFPEDIAAEPDPAAPRLTHEQARSYVVDDEGRRIAHVTGLSFAWINVAARRLARFGWRPGLNREIATLTLVKA